MNFTPERLQDVRRAAAGITNQDSHDVIIAKIEVLRGFLEDCKRAPPPAVVAPRAPVPPAPPQPQPVVPNESSAPLPGFTQAMWDALSEDEKLARRMQAEEDEFAQQYDRDVEIAQMLARQGR